MAINDLDIILQAKLDTSKDSVDRMRKKIGIFSNKVKGKILLGSNLDMSNDQIEKMRKKVDTFSKKINGKIKIGVKADTAGIDKVDGAAKKAGKTLSAYEKDLERITHSYKMQRISSEEFQNSMRGMTEHAEFATLSNRKQEQSIKLLVQAEKTQMRVVNEGVMIQRKISQDQERIKQQAIKRIQTILNKQRKVISANIQMLELYKQKMTGVGGLRGELDIFASKNALTTGQQNQITTLKNDINALNTSAPTFKQNLKQIKNRFSLLRQEVTQSGTVMGRMFENLTKFMRFYIVGGAFVRVIGGIRNTIDMIADLDDQLTQLRKVSDSSLESLTDFAITANGIGKAMGRSTSEVVEATTAFARLGYSIEEASSLAKESMLFATVGDFSVEEASKTLISTVKAFGIEVDKQGNNIRRIIDISNEVSNSYAVTQSDIASILQRSSASMKESGNTLEETIALGVGAQEIVQNSAKVGNALKTVSMRIRGISEEGEDLTDLVPTLEKQFKKFDLTLQKDNKTFKSTYDILKDLSGKWQEMSDFDRANILENVAGKLQGNIIASILNNFESVENSLKSAEDSFGSASTEMNNAMDSIGYKANTLKETMSGVWIKFINREAMKNSLDALNGLGLAFDFLVNNPLAGFLLKTTALSGAIMLMVKGFLLLRNSMLVNTIGFVALEVVETIATFKTLGLAGAVNKLTVAMSVNPLFLYATAIATGIWGVVAVIDLLTVSSEEAALKIQELKTEYDELAGSIEDNKSEIDDITKKLQKLYALREAGKIVSAEEEELKRLEKVNEQLKLQIEFEETLLKLKGRALEREAIEGIEKKSEKGVLFEEGGNFRRTTGKQDLTVEEKIKEQVQYLKIYQKQIEVLISKKEEYQNQLQDLNKDEDLNSKEIVKVTNKIKNLDKQLAGQEKQVTKFTDKIEKLTGKLSDFKDNLVTEETKDQKESLDKFLTTVKKAVVNVSKLIDGNNEMKDSADGAINSLDGETEALEGLSEASKKVMDEAVGNINLLNDAQKELAENNKLSSNTLMSFIEKYPDLLAYMDDEERLSTEIEVARQKEIETLRNKFAEQMEVSEAFYKFQVLSNQDLVDDLRDIYGEDLGKFQDVAEAKAKITKNLTDILGEMWLKTYNAEEVGISAQMGKLQAEFDYGYIDKNTYDEAMKRFKLLQGLSDKTKLDPIDWDDFGKGLDKASKSTDKQASATSFVIDRYMDLQASLEKVNIALEKNQSLMAGVEGKELIPFLEKENELLKEKKQALRALNEERRLEQKELQTQLRKNDFTFKGESLIDNQERLKTLYDQVNKMKSGEARDKKLQEVKNLEEAVKRLFTLQKEIPKASIEWFDIDEDINKNIAKIDNAIEDHIKLEQQLRDAIEDRDKARSENKLSFLTPGTKAYSDELDKQIQVMRDELKGIHDQKVVLDKELESLKEGSTEFIQNRQEAAILSTSWLTKYGELQSKIIQKATTIQDVTQESFEELDILQKQIEVSLAKSAENSREYKDALSAQLDLQDTKQQLLKRENSELEKALKTLGDLTYKQKEMLRDRIDANNAQWWDIEISKINQAKDLLKEMVELEKQAKEESISKLQEQLNDDEEAKTKEFLAKEKKNKEDIIALDKQIFFISKAQFEAYKANVVSQLEQEVNLLKQKEQTVSVLDEITAKEALLLYQRGRQYSQVSSFEDLYAEINDAKTKELESQMAIIDSSNDYLLEQEKVLEIEKMKLDLAYNQITMFDEELSKLEGIDKLKQKDFERLKKQISLEKQRQKVANIENEKNVKIFEDGKWQYVSDPRKLREEKEALLDLEIEYARYENEEQSDSAKEQVQVELNRQSEVLDIRKETLQRESQLLEDSLQAQKSAWNEEKESRQSQITEMKDALEKEYADMDAIVNSRWETLKTTTNNNWTAMITILTDSISSLKTSSKDLLSSIEDNTVSTVDNIRSKISEIGDSWDSLKAKLEAMIIEPPKSQLSFEGEQGHVTSGLTVLADLNKSKTSAPSSSGGGTYYYGSPTDSPYEYNQAEDAYRAENRDAIAEIAKRQNVDMGVATSMYTANLDEGSEIYKSGGLNTRTGMHWLDGTKKRPELVLNAQDTPNVLEAVKITRDLKDGAGYKTFGRGSKSDEPKAEYYNIEVKEVKTNDSKRLIQNLKSLVRAKK